MKFLIDTRSLQAAAHYGIPGPWRIHEAWENFEKSKGKRLLPFLKALEKVSGTAPKPSPGKPGELRRPLLEGYAGLVLTTRLFMLSPGEIDDIRRFVNQGGSLLLMSNHPPFDERDDRLAAAFGFRFRGPIYPWHRGRVERTIIRGSDLHPHPITQGLDNGIAFNNSCRIVMDGNSAALPIARFPDESPPENIFALASEVEAGRLVAVADSGFIAPESTTAPGPGQLEQVDNARFLQNIAGWLCRKR